MEGHTNSSSSNNNKGAYGEWGMTPSGHITTNEMVHPSAPLLPPVLHLAVRTRLSHYLTGQQTCTSAGPVPTIDTLTHSLTLSLTQSLPAAKCGLCVPAHYSVLSFSMIHSLVLACVCASFIHYFTGNYEGNKTVRSTALTALTHTVTILHFDID